MIIKCPHCGTRNRIIDPPRADGIYKCGSCEQVLTIPSNLLLSMLSAVKSVSWEIYRLAYFRGLVVLLFLLCSLLLFGEVVRYFYQTPIIYPPPIVSLPKPLKPKKEELKPGKKVEEREKNLLVEEDLHSIPRVPEHVLVEDKTMENPLPATHEVEFSSVSDAIHRLEYEANINVLDAVVIDRGKGTLTFIGKYDERYPTGSIPYLDLLLTALEYPTPAFSLDPTESSTKHANEISRYMGENQNRDEEFVKFFF